jgi:hypothetical protein
MPELRRVARPGLTPIRGPEKLRQWVDDGRGGGRSTMTEAEEAEANRLQAEARERNHAFALSTNQPALHADRERRQREAEEAPKLRRQAAVCRHIDDALEELTRDRDVIQTTVARCRHAVAVAARECLLDVAVTQASEIIAEERVLAQRRADLKSLGQLLDDEARRLFASRPSLPPIISRALYPSGSRLTGAGKLVSSFDWHGLYERYCTTPPEPETRPEHEEA